MAYKLKLEIFEGPLDLLLYLIKKNDIDISDIPICEITEQYMEYIEMMKMLDLNIVGDFLVMAASLMQIKSKMLLPVHEEDEQEDEEDPRDELVKRLQEYKRFKEVAMLLQDKEQNRRDLFPRNVDEEQKKQLQLDARETYFEATLFDLINALSNALKNVPEEKFHQILREEYTVEQKVEEIQNRLSMGSSIIMNDLFAQSRSKVEVVVIFLALLELIRLKKIQAVQRTLFSDIEVQTHPDYKENVNEQNPL